jgi:hypothetical protein
VSAADRQGKVSTGNDSRTSIRGDCRSSRSGNGIGIKHFDFHGNLSA